jgi:hypothetical protein
MIFKVIILPASYANKVLLAAAIFQQKHTWSFQLVN